MEAREQTYVFDQRWQEERGRLEGVEALWDAGSAAALERMVAAVKPGGVLVLEDYDFSASACHPADENFERVTEAVLVSCRRPASTPTSAARFRRS